MNLLFFISFLFLLPISFFAQTINGTIIGPSLSPIKGVTVINKATEYHTHSDKQGRFSIKGVSQGDTLQFYHISFNNKIEIIRDLKSHMKVVLNPSTIELNEVVISQKLNALQVISDIDIQINPVNSSQEILRKVPGLIIGQHAGGGKAEQIFLRGFDIDHGTDINISVDDLPVNMVSHAHGQGYADLHFVIPETIEKVGVGKGPYYQNKGNFTTAGYVNFKIRQRLSQSSVKIEAGQFDTYRVLGMFNLIKRNKHNAYVSTEFVSTDGPFESPQNFQRVNLLGKYTGFVSNNDKISLNISHFHSKWDASGQIPERAVQSGLISRFGAIDNTEGGITSRSNVIVHYDKLIDEFSSLRSYIYYSKYEFELYSNFSFFLDDPANGDQIRQKEKRNIYGVKSVYNRSFSNENITGNWQLGVSLRNDLSLGNELSHTANRANTIESIQYGDINETNIGGFIGANIELKKWKITPVFRIDYFDFQYNDKLISNYATQSQVRSVVSPKLNFLYNPSPSLQLYLKTGKGFHSIDTRVIISQSGEKILPAAYGFDLGYIWKPASKILFNLAYWYLFLEQELVYVGDAGIVEPSGKTKRHGIDLSFRLQPASWLFWNIDANYTLARNLEAAKGLDYIPLAADFTMASGLNLQLKSGFYGNVVVRHIANRPANEDYSIVAKGYTITDLNAGYNWGDISLGILVQNLFDSEWNETQFATESRLENEPEPTEEIHFTPGSPFFFQGSDSV